MIYVQDMTLMIYHRGAPLCLSYIPFMTAREHEKVSSSSKLPPSPLLVTTGHQSAMTITWVSQLIVTAYLIDNVWNLRYFSLEVKKKPDKQTFNRDSSRLMNFKM